MADPRAVLWLYRLYSGAEGSGGRLAVSWMLAGGVAGGGILIGTLAFAGRGNPGLYLLLAPVLFLLGTVVGLGAAVVLGVIARPKGTTILASVEAIGLGIVVASPLLGCSWLVSSAITVGVAARAEFHWGWAVVSGVGWVLGLALCWWAANEGWTSLRRVFHRAFGVTALAVAVFAAPSPTFGQIPATFRHALHGDFSCTDCHTMQSAHGQLLIRNTADCRGCHHTGERLQRGCPACHTPSEMANVVVPVTKPFILSVRDDIQERDIRFDHGVHAARDCAECHADGPTLSEPNLDCRGCHAEHHDPTNSGCWSCHQPPSPGAHTLAVHTSCSGSGCHVDPPFSASPRTRGGCLWCHEDRVDHEPDGVCVDCHFLSQPLHSDGPLHLDGRPKVPR